MLLTLRIDAPPEPGDACPIADELTERIAATGATVVRCDLSGCTRADLAAVDALARLRLVVRRQGAALEVVQVPAELRRLLVAVGLGDLLG